MMRTEQEIRQLLSRWLELQPLIEKQYQALLWALEKEMNPQTPEELEEAMILVRSFDTLNIPEMGGKISTMAARAKVEAIIETLEFVLGE